jgi:4-amino-4-deoxy-L-arabinose transferase-like glycosyltransferase
MENNPEHRVTENMIVSKTHKNPFFYWMLLVCIIAFVVFVRIRILATPLERDEGEYAYMGQLFLQGVPPYVEAFNMKLPGTSMMYALFLLLFGQTISAIHLGLLIVTVASTFMIFLLTKKWLDLSSAFVSASSFALLSLSPLFLGFAAHATHFVILFALGGTYVLLHALEHNKTSRVFFSGILFACAFLMKQPGIFFFLFGIIILVILGMKENLSKKRIYQFCSFFFSGFLVPLLLILLIIYLGGAFDRFWFWVIQYAFSYGTDISFSHGMLKLSRMLFLFWDGLPLFCILIGIGVSLVLAGKIPSSTKNILLLFGLFSFLALLPGLQFRFHYFILVLPACCFFIGGAFHVIEHILERNPRWKYILILIFAFVIGEDIYANNAYYFSLSPIDIVRSYYSVNYFAESIPISNFLAEHTTSDERIAVIGSEPQIFFYTKRRSVSGHIYMYGMMEPQPFARRMQEEFIADVERAQPNYIVLFGLSCSWGDDANSDRRIFVWSKHYTSKHYNLIGVVDLLDMNTIQYFWGNAAREYTPVSQNNIFIYERIRTQCTTVK